MRATARPAAALAGASGAMRTPGFAAYDAEDDIVWGDEVDGGSQRGKGGGKRGKKRGPANARGGKVTASGGGGRGRGSMGASGSGSKGHWITDGGVKEGRKFLSSRQAVPCFHTVPCNAQEGAEATGTHLSDTGAACME